MATNPYTQAIYDRIKSLRTPMPKPIKPPATTPKAGNPGFLSKPVVPTKTLNSNEPGSLSAATVGGANLQGADYYKNMAQHGNPAEQKAGQNWLNRNPSPTTSGLDHVNTTTSPFPTTTTTTPTVTTPIPATPPAAPPIASAASTNAELTYPNAIRAQYKAGEMHPEETRLRQEAEALAAGYAGKAAAPLGNFNIGGAAQDYNVAQNALLEGRLKGLGFSRDTLEQGLTRGMTAAQGGVAATAPQLTTPGQIPFNPATGTEGSILGSQGGGNGLLVQGNLHQLPQLQAQYTQMQNNIGSIQGIESLLSQTLGGNQNVSDINVFNQAVNHLKANTSSPQYAQFRTLLSSLGQLYSGYFSGSGQETDQTRRIGESLIDGTASNETIKTVLDTLRSEAEVRLNQLHSSIQNISQNPSYLASPNTSGGSTGGGYGGGNMFGSFFGS